MGALSMLLFAVGTVPLMLGFGLLGGRLNKRAARPMRIASGVLVAVMAVAMLTNGASLIGWNLRIFDVQKAEAAAMEETAQQIRSELDWRGYPDITVKKGVPVRWVIHAEARKLTACNSEIVIPALEMRIPLKEGETVIEFTATDAGVIPYTCWMGMLHGSITVTE
ncbi:MAG: sulfite exporter TauE/SafE family protein [Clostridia bacterium]|nr:sulfite exporter TauE/SafE family protein [Clostridia bacterium]